MASMTDEAQPTPAEPSAPTPEDETKRKFREALEAKHGRKGDDHVSGDPRSGGHAHGPVDQKRTFRRKTGG
jgi:hypothetical protein